MGGNKVYRAIGLMSGTSLDGVIDVALIETDGRDYIKPLAYYEHPYDKTVREQVRACFGKTQADEATKAAEDAVTNLHAEAVKALGEKADVIGFHGQTITHDPVHRFTWQLGSGKILAELVGMDVVGDLRQNDIKSGGQGAPLLPLYHKAMLASLEKPAVVLNLGGVANITYLGAEGEVIAFDCGPANAMMDDFMLARMAQEYDHGGRVASQGVVQEHLVKAFLDHDYFKKPPPKSLDRNNWSIECVRYASDEDGMATLLDMCVSGIEAALDYVPVKPKHIYVAGGGRKNSYLLGTLQNRVNVSVTPIEAAGFNGDATEAEGFAYLAVRSVLDLPVTLPSTTGAPEPLTGGMLYTPK